MGIARSLSVPPVSPQLSLVSCRVGPRFWRSKNCQAA